MKNWFSFHLPASVTSELVLKNFNNKQLINNLKTFSNIRKVS